MHRRLTAFILTAASCAAVLAPIAAFAQAPQASTQPAARPTFLILGTFHFGGSPSDLEVGEYLP